MIPSSGLMMGGRAKKKERIKEKATGGGGQSDLASMIWNLIWSAIGMPEVFALENEGLRGCWIFRGSSKAGSWRQKRGVHDGVNSHDNPKKRHELDIMFVAKVHGGYSDWGQKTMTRPGSLGLNCTRTKHATPQGEVGVLFCLIHSCECGFSGLFTLSSTYQ